MRKIFIAFFFVVVSTISAHGEPLSPADIKALLERIRERRATSPNLQADFQEQRKVHLLEEPISSSGKVWFQVPNRFRRETRGNAPSVTISDGQHLWIYYPKFKSAERYTLAKRSPLDAGLAALTAGLSLQNLDASYHVTGTREGDHYLLDLLPRAPSLKRLLQRFEITLDANLQVTRTDMLQPNGDRIVTTYSKQDSAAIPAGEFEFTPPAGTVVTTPLGK